jgi:thioesterase domain-containing protein/acyl carrier protein
LARIRPNGCIECLGRTDFQVKLRGYRIELGEIESVLNKHPAIHRCVVSAREFEHGDRRLIAYFVAEKESAPTAAELRETVKASLPDYMVPAAYISLDALPMTANGKIDRKALPEPAGIVMERSNELRPPKDPVELTITRSWSEALKVSSVRMDDNFFDLGGHSLLALNLASAIEKKLGIVLPVTELFAHPTPASLATFVNQGGQALPETGVVPIQAGGDRTPIFCVFGDVAFLTRHLGADQPLYWFYSRHRTTREKLPPRSSIVKIASYFLNQLRQSRPDGPYVLTGFCVGAAIAYEMAQQLRAAGVDVPLLVLFDPFPTGTALWRLKINRELARLRTAGNARDRLDYLLNRCNQIVHRRLGRFHRRVPRPTTPLLDTQQTQPLAESYSYVHPLAEGAHERYKYLPYNGNTILFRLKVKKLPLVGSDPDFFWKRLIHGRFQCYEMSQAGHMEFFHEPHAEFVAGKIMAMLTEAS